MHERKGRKTEEVKKETIKKGGKERKKVGREIRIKAVKRIKKVRNYKIKRNAEGKKREEKNE